MLKVGVHLLTALSLLVTNVESQLSVQPVTIRGTNGLRSCPSSDLLMAAKRNLSEDILQTIRNTPCGGIGWTKVMELDMSDPSQQCPSPWALYTTPQRSCSITSSPGCNGFSLAVPLEAYTRVCGRATGYAVSSPDGFVDLFNTGRSIDTGYLDGVSLTHGSPRQHIFSLAAGHGGNFRCPCDNTDRAQAPLPPAFVGDNYFCDGDYNGALWDAQDCTTDCCTFNSPPYFTVILPAPTSDNIEVRICSDQARSDEAVHIGLLQLYVQ